MEDLAWCDHRIRLCLGIVTESDEEEGETVGQRQCEGGRWRGEIRTRRSQVSGGFCWCYGSGDDVSWSRRSTLLWCILLVLFGAATAQLRPDTDIALQPMNGVCQSQDIRNSVDQFLQLRGCEVIEGFLQIVLIDKAEESEYSNLTFPELREITGYLLMYRVNNLRSLSKLFPNLSVIRGHDLFFNYALVVFEMLHLQELGLTSLTDIVRGGVYFVKNPMLCYIDTIDWNLIIRQSPKSTDVKSQDDIQEFQFIKNNKPKNECPICSTKKNCTNNSCWNGQECQKVCPSHCGSRTCNDKGECCDDHCIGGCSGPGPNNCLACRGVLFQNECLEKCPANVFEYMNRRCVAESECRNMPKPRQVSGQEYTPEEYIPEKNVSWKPFQGMCIMKCPPSFLEKEVKDSMGRSYYICEPCKGYCKKECPGANVDSISSAQKLRDCTYITGSLEIQIRGGSNVVKELEDNLKMIEEIHGYLKIVRSFPLVSLNFLKKLRLIHGKKLESQKYALVVLDNQNLVELWDWDNRETDFKILGGKLFFHFNPKLCLYKIDRLKQVANLPDYTDLEVAPSSNGDKVACNVTELEATVYKTESKAVLIKWKQFAHYDARTLLGYVVYSIKAPYNNITMYDGRDACGGDEWRVDDVSAPTSNDTSPTTPELVYILTRLDPYTQYAFYVRTYTIATEKIGAQSKIQYFMTHPDIPSAPLALKASSISSSELNIHWSPPSFPNGNVTHYVVTVKWEREDADFLEQRNYCSEPLVVMEKQPAQPPPDEEHSSEGTTTAEGGICDCKKDENDKLKKEKDKEKEIQFQILFEDALHNQVFIKRTGFADLPDNGDTSPSPSANNRPSREKREISYREQKGLQGNHFPSTSEREKQNPISKIAQSKNKIVNNGYESFEHVVWSRNNLVVKNLRHYAIYTISVIACRERIPQERPDAGNCSAKSIVSARTQQLGTADDVQDLKVQVQTMSNHSLGEVLLKWEEPLAPNGLIVTYQIEYRRVDIENIKPTVECITRKQFQNKNNSYTLKNLAPGNYSVRLRATSLADNGKYTPIQYFFIKEDPNVQPLQLLMITLLAIFIFVAILCLIVFYRRRHIDQSLPNRKLIASVNPEYVSTVYVPDQWEVPRSKIELIRELGQGTFGMVYEGIARDVVPDHQVMPCAIKTVNENATDRERIEFLNEASVMKAFNTHHVVRLIGVVSEGQPTLVVMELMANGDLKTYLRSHRPDNSDEVFKQPPSLRRILQMAIEIADGMAYLSAKKFVHRDLAARNCMVAEDLTVKIGDFGMTRDIYETDYYRKGTKGLLPVRWMAPESLKDGVFTSYSDVWSYGIVLWEMATLASQPYQGLSNDQVLRYVIDGGVMERPDNCPDQLYALMRHCWQHKPSGRPTFLDLVSMLLKDVSSQFTTVSFYHSEEGVEIRGVGVAGGEETPLRVTREIEDFSLGSDDEECYKQPHSSGSSKVSNGSTTPTPNGYIVTRPNGNTTIKFTKY
uniref:Tyrosine-protein kinase receptor n=1 Tax=Clastoptera arizonana TaxID=38151 RepID=A0A1B6DYS9_9HEMI